MKPKILVFQLMSGAMVIGKIDCEDKAGFTVVDPLEMKALFSRTSNFVGFAVHRWMPFNEKTNKSIILKRGIQGMTIPDDEMTKYYEDHVEKMNSSVDEDYDDDLAIDSTFH